MKSNLKTMILSLAGTGMVVSLAMAGVKMLTDEPIAEAAERARHEALQAVLPAFEYVGSEETPDGLTVFTAVSDDVPAGYAVETFSDNGFGGRISILVGFDTDGRLHGYRVLSHAETPGLGANMDRWFMADGTSHDVRGTTATLGVKADGGTVDAMTGATISSRAFLEAVNKARQAAEQKMQP
ncbi:MAG: RnfABCDGE type electron transport complex subunit G [Muribaculaceae bacterium]|nr:RnfABCDGE type electron transport complex subunit G [Muribaculaceae bacterium]